MRLVELLQVCSMEAGVVVDGYRYNSPASAVSELSLWWLDRPVSQVRIVHNGRDLEIRVSKA